MAKLLRNFQGSFAHARSERCQFNKRPAHNSLPVCTPGTTFGVPALSQDRQPRAAKCRQTRADIVHLKIKLTDCFHISPRFYRPLFLKLAVGSGILPPETPISHLAFSNLFPLLQALDLQLAFGNGINAVESACSHTLSLPVPRPLSLQSTREARGQVGMAVTDSVT